MVKSSADVVKSVENLSEQNQSLKKEVERLVAAQAHNTAEKLLGNATAQGDYAVINTTMDCTSDQLRNIATCLKQLNENTIAIMGSICEGKPALCLLLPEKLADEKSLDATKIVREAAREIQGGGGGQKTLCVAGGRNADGLQKAMDVIKTAVGC